ncbi:MAG: outer membrane beta-barrel protein [Candidatus Thiodiazotropha sp.]
MKYLTVVVAGSCLLLSSAANSEGAVKGAGVEGNRYFGVMVSSPQYKEDDSNTDFRSAGLLARGGMEFNEFLAVEGQFGLFGEDVVNDRSYQIEYLLSIYARGNLPLIDTRTRLYALAGVTHFSGNVPGFSSVDETAIGYGLGLELYADEHNALTLEWLRYAVGDIHNVDYKLESASLGFIHRF